MRGRRHGYSLAAQLWPPVALRRIHRQSTIGADPVHGYCSAMELNDVRIFVEPQQGATYDQLLGLAGRAEALGYGAFFRSDHYLKMGDASGLPGPSDAWITLAGLARETSTIRLGTLVTAATFRLPGPLAISIAGVDQMSGGRVEFGFGTGWFDAEHAAYGIPFPSLGERFDRLEEQLAIITGLWRTPVEETFTYSGDFWQLVDSPGLPKPEQNGGPPIIIGGRGKQRTPSLAARYAAEFNMPFVDIETFEAQRDVVSTACEAIGRDPATMTFSSALVIACGEDDRTTQRRADAIGRDLDELRANGLAGSPAEIAQQIQLWRSAGMDRIYLQILDIDDLEHLDLIMEKVITQVD